MGKLESIVKFATPLVVAGAEVACLEYSGISKFIQDYELVKANVSEYI